MAVTDESQDARLYRSAQLPAGLWMCTELLTECPDCEQEITEPSGDLEKFIELLVKHEAECGQS